MGDQIEGMSFYTRRRNIVNNVDRNLSNSEPDPTARSCPRCSRILDYLDDEKIFICSGCAWGLSSELINKYKEEREMRDKDKSQGVINTESDTTTAKEESIFVVPKVLERGRRKDPFAYLKGDDAYLEKTGLSFVSDDIIFQDDKSTINSSELHEQRELEDRMKRKGRHVHHY